MNPIRSDVSGVRNQVDLNVPLSHQNAHQHITTPIVPQKTQSKISPQTILQQSSNVNVPLSQKNAHQNFEQNSARSDVQNGHAAESQRQPIYTHVQPILQQNVQKPLSQMNGHQNAENISARPDVGHVENARQNVGNISARPDVGHARESQQPIYTSVPHQQQDPQYNAVKPQVYVSAPQFTPDHRNNIGPSGHYPVKRVSGEATSLFSLFLTVVFVCVAVALSIFASSFSSRRH